MGVAILPPTDSYTYKIRPGLNLSKNIINTCIFATYQLFSLLEGYMVIFTNRVSLGTYDGAHQIVSLISNSESTNFVKKI